MRTRGYYMAKLLLPAAMGLFACSNTFDFMDTALEGPILYFGKDSTEYRDSIKVRFKDPAGRKIPISFSITPDKVGALLEITVVIQGGNGALKAEDASVTLAHEDNYWEGAFPAQKTVPLKMSFLPDTQDGNVEYKLLFAARSTTGLVSKKNVSTLTITTYTNLPPIARLIISRDSKRESKYDYTFDASSSYDQDRVYGGKIMVYSYVVTGPSYTHTFRVSQAVIPYSFPSTGTYSVSLIVNDNDGENSPLFKEDFKIQQ